jgi:CheY-like chemotaxis protein
VNSPDGGRVLVVDDSAVNRMVLTKALSADGHTALTAEHGLQALELHQADGEPGVDVVLLDLEMPELDGYETLTRIKSDQRLRHLPVIVVSSARTGASRTR